MALTDIKPVEMARDAALAMTEPQRIAFAIELVNGIKDEHNAFHLQRLGQAAIATGNELRRDAMLRRVR